MAAARVRAAAEEAVRGDPAAEVAEVAASPVRAAHWP